MEENKKKFGHGGRRPGAGRPSKSGCKSAVIRVPAYRKHYYELLVKIENEWLTEDESKRPLDYLNQEEEKQRRLLISDLEGIIYYEKNRLQRAAKRKEANEFDKRQLNLFDEDI